MAGPRCCAAVIPGGAGTPKAFGAGRPPYPLYRLSPGIGIKKADDCILPAAYEGFRSPAEEYNKQKSRLEGRLEKAIGNFSVVYLRRRKTKRPAAPKPTNASVAGSGTGCRTRLLNVISSIGGPLMAAGSNTRLKPYK